MKISTFSCLLLTSCAAVLCAVAATTSRREYGDGARMQLLRHRMERRQSSGDGSDDATTSPPFTFPGGLTIPTVPDDFTLPTFPGGITIPTLPSTLPSITTPTLPGGSTFPSLPDTLPTIPPNITIPTLPSTLTVPTVPPDFTLPTLPFNITIPPILENVTLPPFDLTNFTLPPLDNFTLPPLDNLTLPPGFENFTLPPDFTFPTILPTALADLLTDLLAGNIPTLDSLLRSALTTNVAGECGEGWTTLFNTTDSDGITNGLRAVDSFGKLGAGYLRGNWYALGDYDQCFSLPNTHYCLSDLIVRFDGGDLPDPELYYAICLPQACSINDTRRAVRAVNDQLDFFNVIIELSSVSCEEETKAPYNAGAVIMILVWALIGATIVGFTVFHVVMVILGKHRNVKGTVEISTEASVNDDTPASGDTKKSVLPKFVLALSLYTSLPAILSTDQNQQKLCDTSCPKSSKVESLSTDQKNSKSRAISCLDGLKVASLVWIILGNTHLWSIFFDSHSSHVYRNVVPRFSYQAILGSPFGYDSLFLISGVIVTFVTLKKLSVGKSKRKYVTLATEFVRRILHFSPVYAVVLFTYWLLTVHFADGPLWRSTVGVGSSLYENCRDNWWTNLFYINNMYPWASLDQCMPWTWYVASELQFFIVAPLLVVPLALVYPLGLTIVGALIVGNLILLGAVTGQYDLNASIFLDLDLSRPIADDDVVIEGHNSIDDIHTKPWARIGPFLLGILLGFILFRKLKPNFRGPVNTIIYSALWVVAYGLCFATVYGTYGAFDGGSGTTEGEAIVYQMFSRITWALGIAILIFIFHNGYGWIVNDFFSMKIWRPLSRLSLLAYLIHPVVLFILFYTRRSPVYSTDTTLAVYAIATVALSYGAAGLVAVFVDRPLRQLETVILNLVGLGAGEEEEGRAPGKEQDEEEAMAEGTVGRENIYFRELEEEDEKRMEAERDNEEDGEDKEVTEKSEI